MRIFVTGATGFVGSYFVAIASANGHAITANGRSGEKIKKIVDSLPDGAARRINWCQSKLSDITEDILRGHDAFLHFAAYGVSPQHCEWDVATQVNVADSLVVMHRAIRAGVSKIVICGSCMEYGRSAERYQAIPDDAPLEPIGPYAASKAAQSIAAGGLAREMKVNISVLRPFNIFGEGQHPENFWPSLKRAALAGDDFPMTLGEQIRDFVPVTDVARMFLKAALLTSSPNHDGGEGSLWSANIGTGVPQTLRGFAEACWSRWSAKGRLLVGALPYRNNEVMRYFPKISEQFKI